MAHLHGDAAAQRGAALDELDKIVLGREGNHIALGVLVLQRNLKAVIGLEALFQSLERRSPRGIDDADTVLPVAL